MKSDIIDNLDYWNQYLKDKSPSDIIEWVMQFAQKPVITTNFGPNATSLLHACSKVKKDIEVIWCDTGFNTQETYAHAKNVSSLLDLNLHIYTPRYETSFIQYFYGVPSPWESSHRVFSEIVKLEPFRRAMKKHAPDVWFTNLRKGQTEHRNTLDVLSVSKDGILKVSPFYYWKESEVKGYIKAHHLPDESHYYNPTKVLANRECGIHL